MSSSNWPAHSVSIIVLPSGGDGDALLELAKNWASADLLDRALWVRTNNVEHTVNEPLRISAECIGKTNDGDVITETTDLFTQLASEYFKTIRFIKVRKASPSRADDKVQDSVVDDCLDALDASLPRQVDIQGEAASLTRYQILTLVCSTAQFSVSEEIKSARGGVTIFASPEDRAFPWSSDAFMRDGDRFIGFTLMHIATISGLWTGVPRGLMELVDIDSKSSSTGAWIARSFVTGVLTDRLAKKSSAETLSRITDPLFKPARPPENCTYILDRNLDEYVDALVDHIMSVDESRLSYDRSIIAADDRDLRDKRAALEWIGEFFRFSGTKTAQIPTWAWKWVKRKFARYTQRKLLGSEKVAVVSELEDDKIDAFDQIIVDTLKSIEKSRLDAQKALATPVKLSQARSTPELWRTMRESIFAAVDGGYDLRGNGFPKLGDDLRPIFESVGNAFPDPSASWEFPSEVGAPDGIPARVNLDNLHDASRISQILTDWIEASKREVDENAAVQVTRTNELEDFQSQIAAVESVLADYDCLVADDNGNEKPITIADATVIHKELLAAFDTEAELTNQGDKSPVSAAETIDDKNLPTPRLPADNPVTEESTRIDEEADSPPPAEVVPPKPSFLSRLVNWLRPKRIAKPLVAETKPSAQEQPVPHLPNLIREHKRLTTTIKSAQHEIEVLDQKIAEATEAKFRREDVGASFRDWHDTVSRTVYAKMFARMETDRAAVASDLERLHAEVQELTAPEPGAMSSARKSFHRALIGLVYSHGIAGILSAAMLPFVAPFLLPFVLPTLIGTFLSGLTGAYVFHFRAWVRYSGDVTEMRARFERVDSQNRRCTEEKFRLEVLHEQALEWLRLLANSLYRPWGVDPAWSGSITDAIDFRHVPLAMNIAQADVADGDAQVRLVDAAMAQLIEPGWRSAAFEDFVGFVARSSGRGVAQFNLNALDNDLPHASNQTRAILAEHQSDETVLHQVAHRRLVRLVEHLQSSTMTEVRPRVIAPDRNPLQRLESRDYDLDSDLDFDNLRGSEEWTTFLSRTLCSEGMVVTDPTALSTLIVSKDSRLDSVFSSVNSVAVVPDYLAQTANTSAANRTKVLSNATGRNVPVEFVIRMDLVGPLDASKLAIYDGAVSAEVSATYEDASVETMPRSEIVKPVFSKE